MGGLDAQRPELTWFETLQYWEDAKDEINVPIALSAFRDKYWEEVIC